MIQDSFSLRNKKIWVAGHAGLVGSALVRRLESEGCDILTASRRALDLRDQPAVNNWIRDSRPDAIMLAAATVGGIGDNAARPADFLYDNLMIEANVIHAAFLYDVEKLLFLGSSCIYPRDAIQPITEDMLLSGPLEPTNESYAIAKIAGLKLCQAYHRQYQRRFISAMPCNLYGPGDRFDEEKSHVIPALMLKLHRAAMEKKAVLTLWGTGKPLREFLYADDLADALVLLLRSYEGDTPVNVGSGEEVAIAALSREIARVAGYGGEIVFDSSRPDGTPRKVIDSRVIRSLGWSPSTALAEGLGRTYEEFLRRKAIAIAV